MPISKESALAMLEELIAEEKPISPGSGNHRGWQRSVRLALTKIFGSESHQLNEFNEQIQLSHEVALLRSMVKEIRDYSNESTESGTVNVASWPSDVWPIIHPEVVRVSKELFNGRFYTAAVLAALLEVNSKVKDKVKALTGNELDGASLMTTAFSVNSPIIRLGDLTTDDGRNIQQGFMHLFAGAMIGIRNPKAHANIVIGREKAIHYLFLASMLLHKLDEQRDSAPTQ
jgi:uncharacterized protein (TIGR02391 family)